MGKRLDSVVNVLLGLAAVAVTVRMVGGSPEPPVASSVVAEKLPAEDWEYAVAKEPVIGDPGSPIQFVVITDFECPFCRTLHERLTERLKQREGGASLSILHFPLASHRFAKQAANAYQCSQNRDAKERMMNALYSSQDSIGLISWESFASRAGVLDSASFRQCVMGTDTVVENDIAFGQSIGVRATPTVLVNGFRLSGPPTERQLDSILQAPVGTTAPGSANSSVR